MNTTERTAVAGGAEVVEMPTETRRSSIVQPLALAVIGALPGLVLIDVVDDRRSVVVAGATAAGAAFAAVACAHASRHRRGPFRRWPATLVALAAGALVAATVVVVLWPGDAGRSVPLALVDAIAHGWASIVTSPVPAPAEPRLLVPLTLTLWAAVAGGIVVALGSSARVAPLLPGAAALVLASVAAGSHQSAPFATGLVFVGMAAIVLTSRNPRPAAGRSGSSRARRSATTAVVFTVVTAGVAALAGPAFAAGRDDRPFDPREHITPPDVPTSAESPIDLVASRLKRPDETMFDVRWSGEPLSTRLVALDTFDGASWTVSGTWLRAGTSLTSATRSGLDLDAVVAEIAVDALQGPWLPSVGDAPEVSGVSAIVHPASGALALTAGDMAGATYTLTALNPDFDDPALTTAHVATDAEAQAALVVPTGIPQPLQDIATATLAEVTAGAPAYFKAQAIADYFRANYDIDPESQPGHSYGRLVEAFTQDMVATSEQFATGFAVVGRVVGLPTRIVVGFGPGTETTPGTYTVMSGDALVWPEVRFEGVGWVPFSPTPTDSGVVDDSGPMELDGQQFQLQVNDPVAAPSVRPQPVGESSGDGSSDGQSLVQRLTAPFAIGLLIAFAAALIALATLVVLKRRQTARRRRAREPRQQVLGAWHDVLDRLVETGVATPYGQTVEEHVADAERVSASLTGLYRPVTRALYGHAPVDTDDAAQAWRCRDRFVRAMRTDDNLARRCRRAIDIRPLLHPAEAQFTDRREV